MDLFQTDEYRAGLQIMVQLTARMLYIADVRNIELFGSGAPSGLTKTIRILFRK